MNYRHTQVGSVMIGGMLVPLVFLLVLPMVLPIDTGIVALAILILAFFLSLFYSLTVEIAGGCLTCSFGIGLIRRRISLSEIEQAKPVKNSWIVGWGIRYWPGYWVWNVSGLDAVELVYKNGTRFRIGTDEPEALVRAIESAQSLKSGGK